MKFGAKSLDKLTDMEEAPPSSSSSSDMSESLDAAKDILAAMASKDAKALDLALQRHAACCEDEYKGSEED